MHYSKLNEEKLASLNYRISADYGRVEIARAGNLRAMTLFGSTINICAKMNAKTPPNMIVIGENMYTCKTF